MVSSSRKSPHEPREEADLEGAGALQGNVGVGGYGADMSRFRLLPTPEQEHALFDALQRCAVCVELGS
jgi:hypothetical protein